MTNGTTEPDEVLELAYALSFDILTLRALHRSEFQTANKVADRCRRWEAEENRLEAVHHAYDNLCAQKRSLQHEIATLKSEIGRVGNHYRKVNQDNIEMVTKHQRDRQTIQIASNWLQGVLPEFSFQRESIRVAGFRQRFPPDYEI